MSNGKQPITGDDLSTDNGRSPTMISLRDVVLIVAGVVSIVMAWGLYGTRLTVVEEKLVTMNGTVTELKREIKEIKTNVKTLDQKENNHLNELNRRLDKLEYEIKGLQKHVEIKKGH